jgi:hypothetical protein
MLKVFLFLLVLLGLSSSAQALPEFPAELQKAADTPCLPHCNVCHVDDNAGGGTVNRPFGIAMQRAGLSGSVYSLDRAVKSLQSDATDSDGDGVADITELEMGDDPNNSYDAAICGPQVGCSAGSALDAHTLNLGGWLLGAWVLRRRKRTKPASAEKR